jgi:hypothetical protein
MTVPHDRRPMAEQLMERWLRWLHITRSSSGDSPSQQSCKPVHPVPVCRSRQESLPCYSDLVKYWLMSSVLVRGMPGQGPAIPAEFVAKPHTEADDSDRLPSADQAGETLRLVVLPVVLNNFRVTIMSTREGDVMPDGPHTTIKGNTTKIEGSASNISVASVEVSQINTGSIDAQKIREFADLISQIAPTLGVSEDQLIELQSGADELREAANALNQEKGRFRHALDRVLSMLRGAGSTAARSIAIGVGEQLIRDLGGEVIKELPH